MTLPELAEQLGIRTTKLRKRAAAAGIVTTDRTGRYVELPEDAAQRLDQPIRAITTTRTIAASPGGVDKCRLPDHAGLPLEALGDPSFREAFTMLRWQRESRLMAPVCGLPQNPPTHQEPT